ncbi:MAG: NTP transferase domain-containing protein, partial [Cellulosilyticum sp.]|nr:NTP transferase domain-containing protein [Cellulosilyticum sp.]
MEKVYHLLSLIHSEKQISQRTLSQKTKLSLGTVNALLSSLEEQGKIYVEREQKKCKYALTASGEQLLEQLLNEMKSYKIALNTYKEQKVNTAVILAAGQQKDFDKPTALLPIENETLIERSIQILREHRIQNIIVVGGYQAETLKHYLLPYEVEFCINEQYQWTGTMHSLACAKEKIKDDFLLIESDLLYEGQAIAQLVASSHQDVILTTNLSGSGDEAYVELDEEGNLYRISKDIRQLNVISSEMIGMSKLSYGLYQKMLERYQSNHNPYLNYEYMLENISRLYKVPVLNIDELIWGEVDTATHYEHLLQEVYPRILRRETEYQIAAATQEIQSIFPDDVHIGEISFAGGMTNVNYRATLNGEAYILRIPGKCTGQMIDRGNEYYNSKMMSLLGINSDMTYFNPYTGIKLSKYIEGAETLTKTTAQLPRNIKAVANILKKVHTSAVVFQNEFNVFEELERYESLVLQGNAKFYSGYESVKEEVMQLANYLYEELGCELKPCHNDLVPENLIKDKNETLYLIDWEYSGMNDSYWDLAAFMLEGQL